MDQGFCCFNEVGGGLGWGECCEWGGHVGGGRVGGREGGGGGQSHEVGDDVGRCAGFATQLRVNGMGGGQKGSGEQSRREKRSCEGSGGGGGSPPPMVHDLRKDEESPIEGAAQVRSWCGAGSYQPIFEVL